MTTETKVKTGRARGRQLDPYVTSFFDRHGKERFRFRSKDVDTYLPSPGSGAYRAAYDAALAGNDNPEMGTGFCYFVAAREVGLVKIGYAKDVPMRVNHLQVNSPVEVELVAVADGGLWRERQYHIKFSGDRVRGEWFKLTAEIEEEIERLAA